MFSQVVNITLRLLLFRAGPQDFPYSPVLVPWLPALAFGSFFVVFGTFLSLDRAMLIAALVVAAIGLVTHPLLRLRGLLNRFQQTYHALLAAVSALMLGTLPAMLASASVLKQVVEKPGLVEQPGALQVPPLAALTMNMFHVWILAVASHIYRHAVDVPLWAGVLLALAAFFGVLVFTVVFAQLLAPLLHFAP